MIDKKTIASGIVIFFGFLFLVYVGVQSVKWADNIAGQADARNAVISNILDGK